MHAWRLYSRTATLALKPVDRPISSSVQGGARRPCQQTSKHMIGSGMQGDAVALHDAPASGALAAMTVRNLCPQRIFLMAGRAACSRAQAAVSLSCYQGAPLHRHPDEAVHSPELDASTCHAAVVQRQLDPSGLEVL